MPFDESQFQAPVSAAPNTPAQPNDTDGLAPIPTGNVPVLPATDQQSFSNALAYGLPLLGVGLLDTLGQSLHVLHNDTVPNALKTLTGQQEGSLGQIYSTSQQGYRMGGELVGSLIPGVLAIKALKTVNGLREAGSLGALLMNSSSMDVLLGSSADLAAKETAIANSIKDVAQDGTIFAGKSLTSPAITAAKKSYYVAQAIDAVRATTAFELGNYAAFNSSKTYYPPEATAIDQAKWLGLDYAVGGGLQGILSKFAVRNLVKAAASSVRTGAAADVFAVSPFSKYAGDIMFRPGERGVGITAYASMKQDLNNIVSINQTPNFRVNAMQDQLNIERTITKQVSNLAADAGAHPFVTRTSFPAYDEKNALTPRMGVALKSLNKDPTAFLFTQAIGDLPADGAKDFYEGISKTLEEARADHSVQYTLADMKLDTDPIAALKLSKEADANLRPIEEAATEMHYVLEPDGRWNVYKNRADNWLDTNNFSAMKRSTYLTPNPAAPTTTIKNSKLAFKADNDIILHDNFRAEMPAGATPNDYSALYAAGSKIIKEWEPVVGQEFVLTPKMPWRQIEMTLVLAEAKPEAASQIKLGDGFDTLDDARFHVANEKLKEFNSLMPNTSAPVLTSSNPVAAFKKGNIQNYSPAQVIQRLNLPEPSGFAPSPMVELAAQMKMAGITDLNEMFPVGKNLTPDTVSQMDRLNNHLRDIAGVENPKEVVPISGTLLDQGTFVNGKLTNVAPIFVAAKSTPMGYRNDEMIASNILAMRDVQLERLSKISPAMSPTVAGVINKIVSAGREGGELSGAANQARAVQTLFDNVVSGTGQLVYQDRINEQYPALKAMQLIAQDGDKFIEKYVETLAQKSVTPLAANLLKTSSRADLLDFNRIEQAYRHGWDISTPQLVNGKYQFALNEESRINGSLAEYHFPDREEGDVIDFLPDMSISAKKTGYIPLTVSKVAGEMAIAISDMSRQSGVENNTLRVALGHNPIKLRDFHLPTPELSRDGTYFVKNSAGRVVATYGEIGQNAQNKIRAEQAAQALTEYSNDAHVAVPVELVAAEHTVGDETMFNLVDYADQLAKTGAAIKGGFAHTTIDTGPVTLNNMLTSLQFQYLGIGIRSRAAIFEPELNYARLASQAAAAQGANKNAGGINIFDRYIATMFSQNPGNASGRSWIGGIYGKIENTTDKLLSYMYAHYIEGSKIEGSNVIASSMRKIIRQQSAPDEYNQFAKVLDKFNPLQDTNAWAESTFKQKMPWTMRPIAADLTKLSATMSLRFLDLGTVINNYAGLMTNSHSVITALRFNPARETYDDWVARTAAWGTQNVNGITTFSSNKAIVNTVKALWNGELTAPMLDAAKQGYFEPEYASIAKALSTPQTPGMSALHKFTEIATRAADRSEALSRQIAWGMGYKIGKDLHGFTNERDAYIFANNFVNEMIGNYSPNNKPAMFSGALGTVIGTFQTYMFNFYRRLYGAIERGDKAAILAQYAAQASVFGARSVPGYAAWNSMFQTNDAGSENYTTRAQKAMGGNMSELILNGSLSNIPRIWGQDGLAFYGRGSVDFTQAPTTLLTMSKAPPAQFLRDVAGGISDTVKNVFSEVGYSNQEQEEILARMSTNRAFKSIMEMTANVKTNERGTVIEEGTRDAIHVAAALLGTQPSHVRNMQEAVARERNVQLAQEDLRATLSDQTRAIFQSGKPITVEQFQGVVNGYLHSGGNPAYLGQYFRNTFMSAHTPAVDAKLQELGRSGKMLEFENMLAAIQSNPPSNQGNK